jgi:heat shock protein HslJ
MRKSYWVLASSIAIFLAAHARAMELAGSVWQLQSIQSMDDKQRRTTITDPSSFTLVFGVDGRAAFRLDCNRGTGDWKVKPTDAESGMLEFGPIAATKAMCGGPPQLDGRVARDMSFVRSYLLKDGKLFMSLMADGGIYEWAPLKVVAALASDERIVRPLEFAKGKTSVVIRDRIVGHQTIDYQLQAGAGQYLQVTLRGRDGDSYFNLLPPDSPVMVVSNESLGTDQFNGLLPDDGIYTLGVHLTRSAARRNEASDFTLSVALTGAPLKPVPAHRDALLPGTRFHASTPRVPCQPVNSRARQCDAFVVRRGSDGTATVELRWDGDQKRRILFIKGMPKASDSLQPLNSVRIERGWKVRLGSDEHFEVPEGLVFGG